ncbi:MAG: hypothetical protein KKC79_20755 [Gammaproteobacteria bacterium]|nr:hypothetical protein [Gammaproteobacteria bacterium]MBU2288365.1 hypothetical protein [Gammaproteobacteria bacterium]MBU2411067.1 hypothetical protein [Gammaproteobacteria bacterium]
MQDDDPTASAPRRPAAAASTDAKAAPRPYRTRAARRKARRAYLTFFVMLAAIAAVLLYLWFSDDEPERPIATESPHLAARPIERTAALAPLRLPADDAPHGSAMEWWYYNGILTADSGARYSFHAAVFVANALVKHTVMHAALTDLQTGKRYAGQIRTGGVPQQQAAAGFEFQQGTWQVAGAGGIHSLLLSPEGSTIELRMTDTRQPVAHRAAGSETPGLLDFGKGGISYYYSRPRMSATGDVTIDGKRFAVRGDVWFDHQWGQFDAATLGWNWFALHLADGTDVMLYDLFDAEGQHTLTAGTVTTPQGSSALAPGDVRLTPGERWTSPRTGISYPVQWTVELPMGRFEVKALLPDGEFDSRETSGNTYWEGAVQARGRIDGEGFMELSGYDRLAAAQAGRK